MKPKKQAPMRATIKEELVVLTGDYVEALLLDHFIKACSVSGKGRALPGNHAEVWVHRDPIELARGLMARVMVVSVRVRLQNLRYAGWLLSRRGTAGPYTWQMEYRPDYDRIAADLRELGYTLDVS